MAPNTRLPYDKCLLKSHTEPKIDVASRITRIIVILFELISPFLTIAQLTVI